jgi:uncharacterized protein (TIGR03437 family)
LAANPVSAANPGITVQVSSETAPSGGYAQFKVSLTAPALVSTAAVSMTFDAAIFGPIVSAAAFSATGDQMGYASVKGQQVTAYFTSSSASIGQLPVFVVTVPVLATAKAAATSPITLDPTLAPWKDQYGNAYTVNVTPGTFTVGGTLSVESVTPGGGLLPSGTVVTIDGSGFDANTTVTIDGVSLASTQLAGNTQLNVTLGGATEMTGKQVHVSNTSGASVGYFSALATGYLILPALPSPQYTAVNWAFPNSTRLEQDFSCLQNPNPFSVTASYFFTGSNLAVTAYPPVIIPPYGLYIADNMTYAATGLGTIFMTVSAPIRMADVRISISSGNTPNAVDVTLPQQATRNPGTVPAGSNVSFNWQIGTPAPRSQDLNMSSGFPFTVSISGGASEWLQITPTSAGSGPATLTLTPLVSNLGAGTYTGTVTLTENLPPVLAPLGPNSSSFSVALIVSAQATITSISAGDAFSITAGGPAPPPSLVTIRTNGAAAAFTASVTGGNWLSVTPASGTTPGPITLTVNPAGLAPGTYFCHLLIQGPINTLDEPVQLDILGTAPPVPEQLTVTPSSLTLSGPVGAATGILKVNVVSGPGYFTISPPGLGFQVTPPSSNNQYNAPATIQFSIPAAVPGIYQASIAITWPGGSATIPITYTVTASPNTPPTIGAIVGSGSSVPGPIAPGEVISIFGSWLGIAPSSLQLDSTGKVASTLGTTQVLINGKAAPLTYTSTGQINAIVPYEASGLATIQADVGGVLSGAWAVPLTPSAPSIFTASGSGVGQGSVVNQDGSINSSSNPAQRGTAIQIYATGGGQTFPPSSTGSIAQAAANLALTTTVTIGGVNAQVLYAGAAPGEVNGVVQINAIVPLTATPGVTPVSVTIAGAASQPGVTLAIQ